MPVEIPFRREFSFEYGRLERVALGIRRIVARNPSPFTFRGTGTGYVVGDGEVAVIDPGPDLERARRGAAGRTASRAGDLHPDHPHASRSLAGGERDEVGNRRPDLWFWPPCRGRRGEAAIEEGGDWDFAPDMTVPTATRSPAKAGASSAVHTPGHTSNHLCFALPEQGVLFTGDHVMGWSTSVMRRPTAT